MTMTFVERVMKLQELLAAQDIQATLEECETLLIADVVSRLRTTISSEDGLDRRVVGV